MRERARRRRRDDADRSGAGRRADEAREASDAGDARGGDRLARSRGSAPELSLARCWGEACIRDASDPPLAVRQCYLHLQIPLPPRTGNRIVQSERGWIATDPTPVRRSI